MPTIPYITDQDISAEIVPADLVAAIRERRANGALLNLDRMLLHSPPIARGWNTFLGAIRRDLSLAPHLRELAICAIAKLNRAEYDWTQHAPIFLAEGGRQSQLDRLMSIDTAYADESEFNRVERATLNLTREMTLNVDVSTATRDEICAVLSDAEVVELVGVIATYNMVSRFLVALGVGPE